MKHLIKHEQDALRLLQQDFIRDRMIEQARKGELPEDMDMVTGHVHGRSRESFMITLISFCLIALGSFGFMALLNWR